jgi:N-acetylmuramoyl-L-alanine amidase
LEGDNDKPSRKIIEKPIKDTATSVKQQLMDVPVTKKTSPNQVMADGVIFKVQLSASVNKVELDSKNFKGLKNISISQTKNLYKYMYGETSNYEEGKKLLQEAKSKGYKNAYLIAFKDGKSISVQDALK